MSDREKEGGIMDVGVKIEACDKEGWQKQWNMRMEKGALKRRKRSATYNMYHAILKYYGISKRSQKHSTVQKIFSCKKNDRIFFQRTLLGMIKE